MATQAGEVLGNGMSAALSYRRNSTYSRRAALRLAALGGTFALGVAGGCGGSGKRGAGRGGTPAPSPAGGVLTPEPGGEGEANGRPGGTLTLAMPGVPPSLDPVAQNLALLPPFLALACNGLLAPANGRALAADPAGTSLMPDLAAALPEQPDATTYVFHLRKEARWQQTAPVGGRPFTAADVQQHFSRALGSRSALKAMLAPLERVEAVDDQTVRFVLKSVYAPFLTMIAGGEQRFVLPRELAQAGVPRGTLAGTGPFALAKHAPGETASFSRNAAYWRRDGRGGAGAGVAGEAGAALCRLRSGERRAVARQQSERL